MSRVVITTGGTGGHIFPALAVCGALRELDESMEILFIGGTYGPEKELVSAAGIPFEGLPGRGVLGRGLAAIPAIWNNFRAALMAISCLRAFSPDAVAAFGGYASFPAALAAKFLGIPLLLHEQNAIAGSSNKLMGRLANAVCVSQPNTPGLPAEQIQTGNPVRSNLAMSESRKFGKRKNLLVLGGSQGAHSLNAYMAKAAREFASAGISVIHQCGKQDIESTRQGYVEAGYPPDCVKEFIYEMDQAYAWADLILCRSGASTVAEICIAGLPSVLVPFPQAIHDHQTMNARGLQEHGAAVLLPEQDIDKAFSIINELMNKPERRESMALAAQKLARPDAAKNVAREIIRLTDAKKRNKQ